MSKKRKKSARTEKQGPLKRIAFYAGDGQIAGKPINRDDVERWPNGAVVAKRDKLARRMIRARIKKSRSSVEKGVRYAQDMHAQARVLSNNSHDAQRILDEELNNHTPVPQPRVRGDRERMPRHVREKLSEVMDKAIGVAHDVKKAGE